MQAVQGLVPKGCTNYKGRFDEWIDYVDKVYTKMQCRTGYRLVDAFPARWSLYERSNPYSYFPDLTRTRFSVTTMIAPSRIVSPWLAIRLRMAPAWAVVDRPLKRTMQGCGRRSEKTSSPKSLSSVRSTRSSRYARSSNSWSEAFTYPSRAERTSWPRSVNVLYRTLDATQTSRRNLT